MSVSRRAPCRRPCSATNTDLVADERVVTDTCILLVAELATIVSINTFFLSEVNQACIVFFCRLIALRTTSQPGRTEKKRAQAVHGEINKQYFLADESQNTLIFCEK